MNQAEIRFMESAEGNRLAYQFLPGREPTVIFLGGYRSEMMGSKGNWLADHCRDRGRAFLRLDYSGHGLSGGDFIDGTIGQWSRDALMVIDTVIDGPCVLVGSSMGGWIMLLVARALGNRVRGLIGVAAAPDFTRDLMWAGFDDGQRAALGRGETVYLESQYDESSTPVTMGFIEEGLRHLQLQDTIAVECPVHLLHGRKDPDVPWQRAESIMERVQGSDVIITYFKDGDHRLSAPQYLAYLSMALESMLERLPVGT
jgi:pimeloyl-ACP methyl ester carboxylesterase